MDTIELKKDERTDKRMASGAAPVPHQDLTYKIIGCAIKVHNSLGPGLGERQYQRALSAEMKTAGLSFTEEKRVRIELDGKEAVILKLDHLVDDAVVVEEKALAHLVTTEEIAQVVTYLAATGYSVGLLLNFGRQHLQYKRILPPRKVTAWQERIRRYVPKAGAPTAVYPLGIR